MKNSDCFNTSSELISNRNTKNASASIKEKESNVKRKKKRNSKTWILNPKDPSPEIIKDRVSDISESDSIKQDIYINPRSLKKNKSKKSSTQKNKKTIPSPSDDLIQNISSDRSEIQQSSSSGSIKDDIIHSKDQIEIHSSADEDHIDINEMNEVDEESVSRSSSRSSDSSPEERPKDTTTVGLKKILKPIIKARKPNLGKNGKKVTLNIPEDTKDSNSPKKSISFTSKSQFLFSAKLSTYSQLIKLLRQQNFVSENHWTKMSYLSRLCKCFKVSMLPLSKDQSLLKLISLGLLTYDNSIELHRDIFMSYYVRFTSRARFEDTQETWNALGFSSSKITTNEMSEDCILLTILHLLFLFENSTTICTELDNLRTLKEAKIMSLLQEMMRNSLRVLRNRLINSLMLKEPQIDEILLFFQMHSGVVAAFVENAHHPDGGTKAYRGILAAVGKDPEMFRKKFIAMN